MKFSRTSEEEEEEEEEESKWRVRCGSHLACNSFCVFLAPPQIVVIKDGGEGRKADGGSGAGKGSGDQGFRDEEASSTTKSNEKKSGGAP